MPYTTLFFDLDDTLYDNRNGLWGAIGERMNRYLLERMGFPPDEAATLRKRYFEAYGTTLRGLQKHHQVDTEDYLAYVHDLPLPDFLQPAPALRKMLLSLPQARWIFTNADDRHAQRVLDALELSDCFDGIIDVHAIEYACKPDALAYQKAMSLAGEVDPQRCVMFDDAMRNLIPARAIGIKTVLVRGGIEVDSQVDLVVPNLLDLPQVMPELWANANSRRS